MSDLIAKMLQEIDAERPAYPETHYDIGYNNGLTMALVIVRKFAKDNNVLTNADRIRAMSDEELAEFLEGDYGNMAVCWALEWLQQPAKGE